MKKSLDDKVDEVRVTNRLTDSPACIVLNEQDMAMHMQRILKEAGTKCRFKTDTGNQSGSPDCEAAGCGEGEEEV